MIKKIFYGWWVVAACSLLNVYVSGVIFGGFTAFFEPIQKTFGWSYTQISLATSLRGLEMGIFAPFAGFLVDKYGARKFAFFGTFTMGLGLILLSFTQSLLMFYTSILFIAFGAGGCTGVVLTTAVVNWFHNKVGIALAWMGAGLGFGGLMIPLIVRLIEIFQWRTTLILLGLGMWVLGTPLTFVIRNKPKEYEYIRSDKSSQPSMEKVVEGIYETPPSFGEAVKSKAFLFLNTAEVMKFIVFASVSLHIMPYLSSIGFERHTAGIIAGAVPLIGIPGRFIFGWWGDHGNKKNVLVWSFLTMGFGTLFFCFVKQHTLIIPFLLLFSPGLAGSMVLRAAFLREYFGPVSFGRLIGISMGSASLGGVIGPLIAGWTFDTFGDYTYVWIVYFGIMLFSTFLILKIK